MDKEAVYRFYDWKIEDGDYEPKDLNNPGPHRFSRLEKLINLLIAVFVMRHK